MGISSEVVTGEAELATGEAGEVATGEAGQTIKNLAKTSKDLNQHFYNKCKPNKIQKMIKESVKQLSNLKKNLNKAIQAFCNKLFKQNL